MYREQVIQLEDELSRIREEGDVTREIFKVLVYPIKNDQGICKKNSTYNSLNNDCFEEFNEFSSEAVLNKRVIL